MTDNNLITPPPELVEQWYAETCGQPWRHIATEAAQWEHDQYNAAAPVKARWSWPQESSRPSATVNLLLRVPFF